MVEGEGVRAQVVAGELFGKTSSVKTLSPLFYGDIQMRAGSTLVLPAEHEERAAYLATGSIEIEGQVFESGRLVVFAPGRPVQIRAVSDALRGAGRRTAGRSPLPLVELRVQQQGSHRAKEDWQRDRFGQTVPGDETEFIPCRRPRP